ncbi:MAG: phosphatase PAP2 family protein [Actinoallomurus sp.]
MRARLDPARRPIGLLVMAVTCALAFAVLTAYVVARAPATGLDRHVRTFVLGHRTPWLNALLEAWTWLGSTLVLVPVLLAASAYLVRKPRDRHGWYAVASLWIAFGGAMVLYQTFKVIFGRARPPVSQMLTHAGGYAYPSGHATQAITIWGLLAVLAAADSRWRARRVPIFVAAGIVVALVGVSRVYLGVHWLTDVIAGYALGATWLALLLALMRATGALLARER